jgi:hypothetical protein
MARHDAAWAISMTAFPYAFEPAQDTDWSRLDNLLSDACNWLAEHQRITGVVLPIAIYLFCVVGNAVLP